MYYCYVMFFSSPGLSWDAMLKMTGIKLEKINDIDMYLFLEKGIGGGISYISKRYSKSNDNIDIIYWDINNLYGWAMECNYLPYGGFKCLSNDGINNFNIFSIKEDSKIGYILEVKNYTIFTMIIHYFLNIFQLIMIC